MGLISRVSSRTYRKFKKTRTCLLVTQCKPLDGWLSAPVSGTLPVDQRHSVLNDPLKSKLPRLLSLHKWLKKMPQKHRLIKNSPPALSFTEPTKNRQKKYNRKLVPKINNNNYLLDQPGKI